jgi:hypothetical protein
VNRRQFHISEYFEKDGEGDRDWSKLKTHFPGRTITRSLEKKCEETVRSWQERQTA